MKPKSEIFRFWSDFSFRLRRRGVWADSACASLPFDAELNSLQDGAIGFALSRLEVFFQGEQIIMSHPVHATGLTMLTEKEYRE